MPSLSLSLSLFSSGEYDHNCLNSTNNENCPSNTIDQRVWPRALRMLKVATEEEKEFGITANAHSYALVAEICLASGEHVCLCIVVYVRSVT